MSKQKCDFKSCDNQATTKGYVYGHISGSGDKDKLIPVNACDTHRKRKDFFEEGLGNE